MNRERQRGPSDLPKLALLSCGAAIRFTLRMQIQATRARCWRRPPPFIALRGLRCDHHGGLGHALPAGGGKGSWAFFASLSAPCPTPALGLPTLGGLGRLLVIAALFLLRAPSKHEQALSSPGADRHRAANR